MQQKSGIFFALIAWQGLASRCQQPDCPVESAAAYDECWTDWYEVCIAPCEADDYDCREQCDEKWDWKAYIVRPDHCDDGETLLDIETCWLVWWALCSANCELGWPDNETAQAECDKLYDSRAGSI